MDELARLKQNPLSGLRQVYLTAVVAPDSPPSGKAEGVYTLQVVWPFALPTPDYKLVTYSILPGLQVPPESSDGDTTVGLGDALLNFFVAPTKSDSFMWGGGAAVMLPTRTQKTLGSNRMGLGPAAVLFYEQKKWNAGVVLQNVWSLGGTGINEVNELSAQYLFNYNFPDGWYLYSNSTITADWTIDTGERWTVPVGLAVGKVLTIGRQSASITFQGVSYPVRPDKTPRWALNLQFALLFP